MSTPEEESKRLVAAEFQLIAANAEHHGWEYRMEDRGDYAVVYLRFSKPNGRTFVLRLECDDYPRRPPLAQFVPITGWANVEFKDKVDPSAYPTGGERLAERPGKPYRVLCLRGHREFYEDGWHPGWTNPPHFEDTLSQLAVNTKNAIHDLWQ